MDTTQAQRALRSYWWLPLVGLLSGVALAVVVSLLQTPMYTASTQLFVNTNDQSSTAEVFQGSQFSQQRVTSYVRLLTGEELASRIVDDLDLPIPPRELASRIDASSDPDTVLLDVSVSATSADLAQRIARSVGEEFPQMIAELEATEEGAASPVSITVADRPEVPTAPSSPRTGLNVFLGGLVGLLIGAGLAVLRGRLDRSVKEPADVTDATGLPVIGTVLRDSELEKRHVIDRAASSRSAEDYRQLRNNLQFLDVDRAPKVIMVTSALPSEGKTTAVVNLAVALADAGRKVIVVEADLRKPKVTRYLGLVGGVGLTNVLAGSADVVDVVQSYGDVGMHIIGAGPTPPNPGELLASDHMAELLGKMREAYDFVLIDAPPVLPVADASGLATRTDGVLLSVRYGSTRREQLQQAAATLERVGTRTLGVILNIVPANASLASAYGYGYKYGEDRAAQGKHQQP